MDIEYECYGVIVGSSPDTHKPRPDKKRELLTSHDNFADTLFEALSLYNVSRFRRLKFKAIDQDSGEEWHVQRQDFNEALDKRIKGNIKMLQDPESVEKSGDSAE